MDELFFKLQRVSVKINNDLEWNFTTCIPFGTPYSAIDGVMPLLWLELETLCNNISHISQRLEIVEKVRAFVNQAIGEQQKLHTKLETTLDLVAKAQNEAEDGVNSLQKAKQDNRAL
uniref:Uncharacterized protein n=1 Tax=Vitis vinifera TaxID=29760 RepID=A5BRY0_VITVI|nr:hypothetical protein VITISV_035078 [Vitis vinifera]